MTSPTDELQRLRRELGQLAPVWDQRPTEPAEWYRRFHAYLTMPGTRSALRLVNDLASDGPEKAREGPVLELPGSWKRAMSEWQWRIRAREYDRYQVLRDRLAHEEERIAAAAHRRATLQEFRVGLADEIARVTKADKNGRRRDRRLGAARVSELASAVKIVTELERKEYGESDPATRLEHSGYVADGDASPTGEDVITIDPNLLLADELGDLIPLLERFNARVDAAVPRPRLPEASLVSPIRCLTSPAPSVLERGRRIGATTMAIHRSPTEPANQSNDDAQAASARRRQAITTIKDGFAAELTWRTGGAVTLADAGAGAAITLLVDRTALTPDEDRTLMALVARINARLAAAAG